MNSKLVPVGLFALEKFREVLGTVAMTKGVYDLTHAGHVRSLQAASRLGKTLVVGVATEESVQAAKGPGRPVLRFAERVEILSAFECVRFVVAYDVGSLVDVVRVVRPDYYCASHFDALSLGDRAELVGLGVRFRKIPRPPVRSTSDIIAAIRSAPDERMHP